MYARKVDANQQRIIDALRACGVTVEPLFRVGNGAPDLLAGFRGKNILLEVKMPGEDLNDLQREWHADWRGTVYTVHSEASAVAKVTAIIQRK